jgi:hypothetical protein
MCGNEPWPVNASMGAESLGMERLSPFLEGMKNAQAGGLRIRRFGKRYFFGVVWVAGWAAPERTERSALTRDSMMVRPMEVSMKTIAE